MYGVKHESIYFGWEEFEGFIQEEIFPSEKLELQQDDFYFWSLQGPNGEEIKGDEVHDKLSEYFKREVTSSHVDDNGVWIVFR